MGNGTLVRGMSAVMAAALSTVAKVARTEARVLITGETGTGKELIAREIHRGSRRAGKPFVAVNCGSIPEHLLESELFGHTRGAFTDATHKRVGMVGQADGGTLFLDEIGDMPLALQVKLLRLLQEGQYRVLGETNESRADVRVISATHQDLKALIKEERFREDLYYRLKVVEIKLPPLRERREDVPGLVDHFITKSSDRNIVPKPEVTPAALERLMAYSWPGNIRELENVIEGVVVLLEPGRPLDACDLPPEVVPPEIAAPTPAHIPTGDPLLEFLAGGPLPEGGISWKKAIGDLRNKLIQRVLRETKGNTSAAARLLGVSKETLYRSIHRPDEHL